VRQLDRRRFIGRALGLATGLVLGGAAVLSMAQPAEAGTSSAFRWCRRCQGMWFIAGGDNGHCPVSHLWDHSHYQDGSASYWFVDEQPAVGQDHFGMPVLKWCLTCKTAYIASGAGTCPTTRRDTHPLPRLTVSSPTSNRRCLTSLNSPAGADAPNASDFTSATTG
jgi:hypothetical protein